MSLICTVSRALSVLQNLRVSVTLHVTSRIDLRSITLVCSIFHVTEWAQPKAAVDAWAWPAAQVYKIMVLDAENANAWHNA